MAALPHTFLQFTKLVLTIHQSAIQCDYVHKFCDLVHTMSLKYVLIYDIQPNISVCLNEDDLSVLGYHTLSLMVMVMLEFSLTGLEFNEEFSC